MSVDVAGFRARFTEFANVSAFPDMTVQVALDDAALQINRGLWGNKADLGQYYLAAHSIFVNAPTLTNNNAGLVTQESVGQISRSYAAPPASLVEQMGDLSWSKYGILYWRLKRLILASPVVL